MIEDSKILDIIYKAVSEINEQLPKKQRIDKSPESELFGKDGKLDSLGLVNLIVTVEELVEDELEETITLADEKAMSQNNSPFRSIDALAKYISNIIN